MRGTNARVLDTETKEIVREARRRRGLSRRAAAVLVTALVASLAFSGLSLASVLTTTPVTEKGGSYGVTAAGVPNWPSSPAAFFASVPSGVSTCATTTTFNPSGSTVVVTVGVNGTTPTCTAGYFAEEFSFPCALTMTAETDAFAVYSSWVGGNSQSYSGSATLSVSVTAGTTTGNSLVIYVSYGQASVPPTISTLSVIVT